MKSDLILLLSSSVISVLISSLISLRSKQNEYRYEYFKLILKRRIEAYELVETLIANFKTAIHDGTPQLYHAVFDSTDVDPNGLFNVIFRVSASGLWLSGDLFEETRRLSIFINEYARADCNWIAFGKAHYMELAQLRQKIEHRHTRDLATLHKVNAFLRNKKHVGDYEPIIKR